MARALSVIHDESAELREIEQWYREKIASTLPPTGLKFPPVHVGHTWDFDSEWCLPEFTLGWEFLAWTGRWLSGKKGPWQYTPEQARFILWFYAVDENGEFVYHSAALQRMKGWGKDPLAATLGVGSMVGPTLFDHWDGDRPVARDNPNAWVQVVAVSQKQTQNTMKVFPGLIPAETRRRYGLQIGKENLWAMGDTRQLEALTSSPLAVEGGRPTLVIRNETQNWVSGNQGHELAEAIDGNATKSERDAPARVLDIFNAYRPGRDSVAQRVREAFEDTQGEDAKAVEFGLMYDSLEAPADAPLAVVKDGKLDKDATESAIVQVVEGVRGDAVWLNPDRIKKSIQNTSNTPSESRRKWYNQIVASDDAWVSPQEIDPLKDTERELVPGEDVTLFFDGSKSDDATALVGCCMSDGHVFTVGMWQRPPGRRGDGWIVDREAVDQAVKLTHESYRVVGFFGDPSHVLDDETMDRFWDPLFDEWHRRWGRQYKVQASRKNTVMWDMTSRDLSRQFAEAVGYTYEEIKSGAFTWDGDARLRKHMLNACRFPVQGHVSIAKDHRESKRKIDLAVCMVGARMVRRLILNNNKRRGGRVW